MSEDEIVNETESLGEFLRDARKKQNISLEDARDSTKLSLPILRCIESNDFENMPAEAFCRGFYVMYAKYLQLDHTEVLARYLDARGLSPTTPIPKQSKPPVSNSRQFSSYAEPSSVSPRAGLAVFFLLLLGIIVGTCWYMGWNPINFINTQLNPQQNSAPQSSPSLTNETPEGTSIPEGVETITKKTVIVETVMPVIEIKEDVINNDEGTLKTHETFATTLYHIELTFRSTGTLTATLDDGFSMDRDYFTGQTLQWDVQKSILLDMPEAIDVSIQMNGIELPLPQAVNGRRLLSLPEDYLN